MKNNAKVSKSGAAKVPFSHTIMLFDTNSLQSPLKIVVSWVYAVVSLGISRHLKPGCGTGSGVLWVHLITYTGDAKQNKVLDYYIHVL